MEKKIECNITWLVVTAFWVIISPLYLMFLLFASPFYAIAFIYKSNRALDVYLNKNSGGNLDG